MPFPDPVLAFSFPLLPAGSWIDLACVALVVLFAVLDAVRGFSTTLSVLLGLLVAIQSGHWLYRPLESAFAGLSFCKSHPAAGALLPYVVAISIGILVFLLFRFFLRRFFRLVVESPMDQILGAVAGAVKALLLLLIVFSGASLLPKGSKARRAFCEESRTGRQVVPLLHAGLVHGMTLLPHPGK